MLRFNKKNHILLCFIWAILLHNTTAIAQPDSIAYEDLSKFEDDLYWTNIYVDRITKDTIVSAHTTQDYFVKKDRKSTRLNSSHSTLSRMPSSA